ncbi:MAG: DNA mismatch repair endonuclease MutH [Gammaproteobacteria bacterium CG22_combo_CG10-13_8_21_14_all_40_8]|nr:MAG: DNA mismatch repair endonuclease MutH [Gammaproteobacteria bacterium CG22_combo_CG10-13_8_21_14_all_40_8]
MTTTPPQTEQQLMQLVYAIAGMNIAQVAQQCEQIVPENLMHNKGFVGQLIEMALGAESGSLAQPDFPHLGIELKTLPINAQGRPKESTYVSVAPLTDLGGIHYENSIVGQKLNHVLWIPIEGEQSIPLAERRIGQGFLWKPSEHQYQQLHRDFTEIMETIALGQVETISAHQGEVLQLRPKAANAKALTQAIGPEGRKMMTLPRGFYLRPSFTASLLDHFIR